MCVACSMECTNVYRRYPQIIYKPSIFGSCFFCKTVPRNCWAARQPGPSKWGEAKKFPASPSHVEEEQALQTRSPWNHPRTKDKTLTGLTSHPNKAVSFQLEEGLSCAYAPKFICKMKNGSCNVMHQEDKSQQWKQWNELHRLPSMPAEWLHVLLFGRKFGHSHQKQWPKAPEESKTEKANQMEEIRSGSFPFPASKHLLPTCANTWIAGFNNHANSPAVEMCVILFHAVFTVLETLPLDSDANQTEPPGKYQLESGTALESSQIDPAAIDRRIFRPYPCVLRVHRWLLLHWTPLHAPSPLETFSRNDPWMVQ